MSVKNSDSVGSWRGEKEQLSIFSLCEALSSVVIGISDNKLKWLQVTGTYMYHSTIANLLQLNLTLGNS